MDNDVHQNVKQSYGERARRVSDLRIVTTLEALCCADGSQETNMDRSIGAFSNLYLESEVNGLPMEAVAASAGCGNPTALAGLSTGEKVLDLGSGGGIDCFLAAKQVGPEGHVTGVDMTPDMLALARKNAERLNIKNVEFVEGYIEDIPVPSNSFDVVISNCVVCLSPNKDAVANETYRVLRSGGRLHISDMMALGPMPEEFKNDPKEWARCASGAEERDVYLTRLEQVGFIDIKLDQDGESRSQRPGMPDLVSIKVVAYKP